MNWGSSGCLLGWPAPTLVMHANALSQFYFYLAGLDVEGVDDLLVPVTLPAVVDRGRHVAPLQYALMVG